MRPTNEHCHALSKTLIWTRFIGADRIEINSDQVTFVTTDLNEWIARIIYGGYVFLLVKEHDFLSISPGYGWGFETEYLNFHHEFGG